MRKIFFILFILTTTSIVAQNIPLEIANYAIVSKEIEEAKELKMYIANAFDMKKVMAKSNKQYKLIYTFATWCGPCVKYLPNLITFINSNQNIELYIVLVEKNDNTERLDKLFLFFNERIPYTKPVFLINDSFSRRKWKRIGDFVNNIVPGHKEYGMSLHILVDEKGITKYASTYNETSEEKLKKIAGIVN